MRTPFISIITISYNNLIGLKKTVNNIWCQNFSSYHHIIMDGNSNDGTKDYLDSITDTNTICVSEPDNGIYDAMNKGIKLAKGEWVIFMNAGDVFASKDVIQDFISKQFSAQVVYGNCCVNYENGLTRNAKPNSLNSLWKGMSFSHQTVFISSTLIKANSFDLNYSYCADFNQLYGLFLQGFDFQYWDYVVANIEAGGVSDSKRYISTNEVYKINKRFSPKLKNHFYFIPKIIWGFAVVKIKSILPKKIVKKLTELKYK